MTDGQKLCKKCKLPFILTGNNQQYCLFCKEDRARERGRLRYKNTRVTPVKKERLVGKNHPGFKTGVGRSYYCKLAFSTYGKICCLCGGLQNLCVHHKDENRFNNEVENLEVICRRCHAKKHNLHKSLPKGNRLSECKKEQVKTFKRDENGKFIKKHI